MRKKHEMNVVFGKRLRFFRERAVVSQEDLAAKLGYGKTGMISQVENGLVGMEKDKVLLAAEILEIPPFALYVVNDLEEEKLLSFLDYYKVLTKKDQSIHYEAIKSLIKSDLNNL